MNTLGGRGRRSFHSFTSSYEVLILMKLFRWHRILLNNKFIFLVYFIINLEIYLPSIDSNCEFMIVKTFLASDNFQKNLILESFNCRNSETFTMPLASKVRNNGIFIMRETWINDLQHGSWHMLSGCAYSNPYIIDRVVVLMKKQQHDAINYDSWNLLVMTLNEAKKSIPQWIFV